MQSVAISPKSSMVSIGLIIKSQMPLAIVAEQSSSPTTMTMSAQVLSRGKRSDRFRLRAQAKMKNPQIKNVVHRFTRIFAFFTLLDNTHKV